MKTKTALALATAGALLTGSAALAVNTLTLNGSPAGNTVPANGVLLPRNSTTAEPVISDFPSPASATSPAATSRAEAPSKTDSASDKAGAPDSAADTPSSPRAADDTPHSEDVRHSGTDDAAGSRPVAPAPAPAPARSVEPGDDHSGGATSRPGPKHSGKDD